MQINFPDSSTIANVDEIIGYCVKSQKSNESVTFNFNETTFIDPFAITIIAGTIHYCLQKWIQIKYVPPKNEKINNYLSQIGFNSFFHINGKDIHRDTSTELRQLKALEPFYMEELIVLIDARMELSKGVKDSIKMSMQEIFTNVFDHSKSANGCFACAQYYPILKKIKICITDFGVGILSNLSNKYGLTTDIEAIEKSVEEGVTSRTRTAGFGLFLIRDFLKINEGILTIISGDGEVIFYNNKVNSCKMTERFAGTIVNLEINANKESLYYLTEEKEYLF